MDAVNVIKRVIGANFLSQSLTFIPSHGATSSEMAIVEAGLGRRLSEQHRKLLENWNGINLDVIRVFGATATCGELMGILDVQEAFLEPNFDQSMTVFCASPSGFTYFEEAGGRILQIDSDGGEVERVASSLDDFFCRLVFGCDAAQFAGDDWFEELRSSGLV